NALPSQAGQPPVEASPLPRGATPQRQRNAPPSQSVEPPAQASPPQPAAIPQTAPAPQTNDGGIGQERVRRLTEALGLRPPPRRHCRAASFPQGPAGVTFLRRVRYEPARKRIRAQGARPVHNPGLGDAERSCLICPSRLTFGSRPAAPA